MKTLEEKVDRLLDLVEALTARLAKYEAKQEEPVDYRTDEEIIEAYRKEGIEARKEGSQWALRQVDTGYR